MAMMTERAHSRLEKLGNSSYAMAVMILPIYGGLYLAGSGKVARHLSGEI
jgi:hypothetical protein